MYNGVAPILLLLTVCGVLTAAQQWGAWQPWTDCKLTSFSCGSGKRYRERRCESGQCEQSADQWQQQDVCFGPPCSGNNAAIWTLWSEWTACTSPGCQKDGDRGRWQECRGSQCPNNTVESVKEKCQIQRPCKKDGVWSNWSAWSACSASCGQGYQSRQRNCKGVQNGGDLCTGSDYHTKACLADQQVCYREASWGPWGPYEPKYEGCMVRKRICEKPYPLDPTKNTCDYSDGGDEEDCT